MLGRFISTSEYAELLARGRKDVAPMLEFEPGALNSCYNRKPFLLGHRLTTHPQFSLAQLFALCRRMPAESILYRVGGIPGDAELDSSYERYRQGLTLDETLDHFEERQAYVCINNPERDPAYRPVIEGLLAEIAAQIDPIDSRVSWYSTYIFISSRDSVTPYHMDREMNFLLQIRGHKTVYLWDQSDSEIMTAAQKDFLLSHVGARPAYLPSFESKAMTFELRPGLGVHHPFISPHRVHTGAQLSISLAVTFRTRRSDVWTDAHRFNTRMRRFGLTPRPVGRSWLLDRAKSGMAHMGQRVHRRFAEADHDAAP
jgi:hypothetical protein